MKLIVGLGNPGKKYEKTRHNIGFFALDRLVKMYNLTFLKKKKFNALIALKDSDFIFVKPLTFMNHSGDAVSAIFQFYKIGRKDLWVIHDDVDLPQDSIKIQVGGQSAGHHGVESIIFKTGSIDFVRFRVGIGRPGNPNQSLEDYVLSPFPPNLKESVSTLIEKVALAVNIAIDKGIKNAMNEFN